MAKEPTASAAPVGRQLPRKLTIKELGWDKGNIQAAVLADREARIFLARFVGVASALKPYRVKAEGDRNGEIAYGLVGEFEGTNHDGEVKIGAVLYLPGYVNEMIAAVLSSNPDASGVRVAYDVYARFDEAAATSYVFDVFDLINVEMDSVKEVKASIAALPMPPKVAALPAS